MANAPDKAPPPINPLRLLCDQLGITPAFLAREMGLPVIRLARSLSNPPRDKAVIEYLRILQHLGIKMRLAADAPIKFWILNREIDCLIVNNEWRKTVDMCPVPRNHKGITKICLTLKDRGMTFTEIARYLRRHFIPMGRGSSEWSENSIKMRITPSRRKRIAGVKQQDAEYDPKVWRERWRDAWRQHVVGLLLARIFPVDPKAFLRWGIGARTEGRYTILESQGPVPACAKRWLEEGIKNVGWFGGHAWGIGEPA